MEGAAAGYGEDVIGGGGAFVKWRGEQARKFQHYLDKSTPHTAARWLGSVALAGLYCLRVYLLQGFYIVTYGVGIYLLNLLIGFLSPQVDPEAEGPALPSKGSDEFKPFIRRLPEFKFWYAFTKAFCVAFALTFFSIFDVPVFWPILLLYWIVLFVLTMKRQIRHMIKYKYVPFSIGKQDRSHHRARKAFLEIDCSYEVATDIMEEMAESKLQDFPDVVALWHQSKFQDFPDVVAPS